MRAAFTALEILVVLRHVGLLAVGAGARTSNDAASPRHAGEVRRAYAAKATRLGSSMPRRAQVRCTSCLTLDDDQVLRRRPELVGLGDLKRTAELRAVAHGDLGVVEAL